VEFALTEDQTALQSAVRDLIAAAAGPDVVRAVADDPDGDGDPPGVWARTAEQGWPAILVPEEHDGLGLGMVEAQVIARALGAGVAPGPWRGTVLAAEAFRLAGSPAQQASWLPRLAAGDVVGACTLRGAAPGTLPAVEYGGLADVIIARSGAGLAVVERTAATPRAGYDGTVRLADVEATAGEALPGADAAAVAELVAADLVGLAREALTRTVAYDRDRQQFGVPVGSFQAIKHALADLHVAVTLAEHAVLYAAHALDAGLDDVELAVAVAKAKAGDAALGATAAMIQYHGGIGYTWEHEAHLFYKRAKRLAGQFGTTAAHRARIAELTIG
jgi:alkylation response protein AidB-like acyl-CoA dehydrogenase